MAEMTIRLRIDPNTGKKDIIVSLDSDADALPHEHEQQHRALVEKLIEGGIIKATELGQLIVERVEKEKVPETPARQPAEAEPLKQGAAIVSGVILHFPKIDTLRLSLTSGAISEAVWSSSVRFGSAEDQSLWVEPAEMLAGPVEKELRRLGVRFPRSAKIDLPHRAAHWLQMLPLTRTQPMADVGDKTPVLFEVTGDGQFAELATEMLRLGNDRQSFRVLDDGTGAKILLQAIGPPYYTLLRALDKAGQDGAPVAYHEVAPQVWVQVGYTHSLAEHLRPPAGQLLLICPPHQWTCVPDAKLRDIYEVLDFRLAAEPSCWRDIELPARIRVPVKLTRAGAPEAADLWLLRDNGIVQLEDLVRSSDNELLARFAFAVGEKDGGRLVVLRARPSKAPPPVLVLDGLALRSYLRIPNLFVPVEMALQPPLRRDAVTKLLAGDKTRITWLVPHSDNTFTPESLPDTAFRALSEWIEYVLECDHLAVKTWIGATQFDFEGFICRDDAVKEKKPPREPAVPKHSGRTKPTTAEPHDSDDAESAKRRAKSANRSMEDEMSAEPSELAKRLRDVEEAFAAMTVALDDPDRQKVWEEMAHLNGALHQHADAAVCWSNALWEQPHVPRRWPEIWFRLEAKHPAGPAPTAAQVMRLVKNDTSTHANVRLVTAYLVWAAALPSPPTDLARHLNATQQFIERHESYLGVRAAWLAWMAIHRLAGGDVLVLARARDRLLERLFAHGLTPELDLPAFLRFSGVQARNRFRTVRDQVGRLRRHVHDWAKKGTNATAETHAYIDLIFAFGLARLGETNEARTLRDEAALMLANADEVHSWLYEAFEFRIQQALDRTPNVGRLPEKLLQRLDEIEHPSYLANIQDADDLKKAESAAKTSRFKIERLCQFSRILEPHEKIDSYRGWQRESDGLTVMLKTLPDVLDRAELARRLDDLLNSKKKTKGQDVEARIVIAALELAPRLGQSFGEQVLERTVPLFNKVKDGELVALLLQRSLFLAAHYDREDDVQRYVALLHQLLESPKAISHEKLVPLVAGSFRGLRKFGLRDAVAQLMKRLSAIVDTELRPAKATTDQRKKRLVLSLEIASSWFFFGEDHKARKILDEARDALIHRELIGPDHVAVNHLELARAYLSALGQAPMEFALARIMEFFRKVEGIYDNWTTQTHYSLSRLSVVEAMMLAVISDDFTLDREARKRLDDDEYLVRRRIHRDMNNASKTA